MKIKEAYKTQNRLYQKRKYPYHTIIKTINIQNKEIISKVAKEKG